MDLTLVPLSDLVAEVRRRSMIVRAAKKQASPLTHQELISVISYDPVSGVFFKLGAAGDGAQQRPTGHKNVRGYMCVYVAGRSYAAHRLAFFYMQKEWPPHDVDHINGDRTDNRFSNLRQVTRKQNKENMTVTWAASCVRGVTWCKKRKAWKAQVKHNQRHYNIGYFSELEAAAEAAKAGRDRLFTHHTN